MTKEIIRSCGPFCSRGYGSNVITVMIRKCKINLRITPLQICFEILLYEKCGAHAALAKPAIFEIRNERQTLFNNAGAGV